MRISGASLLNQLIERNSGRRSSFAVLAVGVPAFAVPRCIGRFVRTVAAAIFLISRPLMIGGIAVAVRMSAFFSSHDGSPLDFSTGNHCSITYSVLGTRGQHMAYG